MTQPRIGVLGGSFDPVHVGHLILAETACEQAGLDRVLFIPAGHQWRKTEREMTPARHRLEMVRLAIEDNPRFDVSSVEIEREGPSYTAITLEALRDENPARELAFILGRDALADLPHWHAPERIVALAILLVAGRLPDVRSGASQAVAAEIGARIEWLDMPAIEISSADIRGRARSGRSIRYLVPERVTDYIAAHRLYLA